MLVVPPSLKHDPTLPKSLTVAGANIEFTSQVRNLGVIFDDQMSFKPHVTQVCRMAYYELRKISSIRHYLTPDATKTLVVSLVLSRLDYGNSLLAGSYQKLLDKLQRVQNNSARLITKTRKRDHISPILRSLHWLPLENRIQYKLCCICYSFCNKSGPKYLSEMISPYSNLPQLRSSADKTQLRCDRKRFKSTTFGERSFSFQGPLAWDSLPQDLRESSTPMSFRSSLKTHLFRR